MSYRKMKLWEIAHAALLLIRNSFENHFRFQHSKIIAVEFEKKVEKHSFKLKKTYMQMLTFANRITYLKNLVPKFSYNIMQTFSENFFFNNSKHEQK